MEEEGTIDGAIKIFFADLPDKPVSLPKDKPLAVTCTVGNRTKDRHQHTAKEQA